jgi:hypothetical protein
MRDSPLVAGDLQPEAAAQTRWLESLLLTAAIPGVRIALGESDPFLWHGPFPWLAFVPLSLGVQHGLACALVSALLLSAGAFGHAALTGGVMPGPALGFACGAVAAIAGRARDSRRERADRLKRRVVQLEAALDRERLGRQVLQLSHQRLAERLAGAPHSLEASVKAAVARVPALRSWSEAGRLLLDLLAQHAELQRGSVFALDEAGRLIEPAAATLGWDVQTLGASDGFASHPLVASVCKSRRPGLITELRSAAPPIAEVLAALPLLSADARLAGVLLIEQVPFVAFHAQAMRRAFVIVSRVIGAADLARLVAWQRRPEPGSGGSTRPVAEESLRTASKWENTA